MSGSQSEPPLGRPPFIRNVADLPSAQDRYPGSDEDLSIGTPLSRPLGLERIGVHHELVPPGVRTSWPHAEEKEEEIIYVLDGSLDVWIDGRLHSIGPGDVIAFPPGTGNAHTFINNGSKPARLLVVGERIPGNRVFYPMHPEGYPGLTPERRWIPEGSPALGPHDGLPDRLRERRQRGP